LLRPAIAAANPGLLMVGSLAVFETLVYGVLQSEPRYSIPLRPLEMMLAASALWWMLQWRQRRSSTGPEQATRRQAATAADDPVQRGVP
jgi:hypothetical protein